MNTGLRVGNSETELTHCHRVGSPISIQSLSIISTDCRLPTLAAHIAVYCICKYNSKIEVCTIELHCIYNRFHSIV